MALTDTAIRKAKSTDKTQRLFDGGGLYLEISPAGGKWWRWKYRFGGKEKRLSLGTYPDTGLADARERRDAARKLLAAGIDVSQHRKAAKAAGEAASANSFEVVAREWFAKQKAKWAVSHADKVIRRLERDIFPWLGQRPVAEITAPELLKHLERIEQRGAIETAHRALQTCGQVFRYAIQTGRAERAPSTDLRGALTPWRPVAFAAAITPEEISPVLRKIHDYTGGPVVRSALRLATMLFCRPGELARMKWAELDLGTGQWRYLVSKTNRWHIAALPSQAVEILRDLQPLTGRREYVFPGGRDSDKPMSANALLQAMRRSGIKKEEQTVHGFRHMASTRLNEMGWNPDAIEAALTHRMPGVRGVYAGRAQYLEDRREMMQAWADYLDGLRTGSKVVPIVRQAA